MASECRICYESEPPLARPCKCSGSIAYAHLACLVRHGRRSCQVCGSHLFSAPVLVRMQWEQEAAKYGFSAHDQCAGVGVVVMGAAILARLVEDMFSYILPVVTYTVSKVLLDCALVIATMSLLLRIPWLGRHIQRLVAVPLELAFYCICAACAGLKLLQPYASHIAFTQIATMVLMLIYNIWVPVASRRFTQMLWVDIVINVIMALANMQ